MRHPHAVTMGCASRGAARFLTPYVVASRSSLPTDLPMPAIDSVIDQCLTAGVPPALLSIHSFTESWKGVPRPWHVGILWDKDARLAKPLLAHFEAEGTLIVGDNQPYSGALEGDCMWQHGTMRGLAHAIIEVRQDLIREASGQKAWAGRIVEIVEKLRARADLHLNVIQRRTGAAPAVYPLPHGAAFQAGRKSCLSQHASSNVFEGTNVVWDRSVGFEQISPQRHRGHSAGDPQPNGRGSHGGNTDETRMKGQIIPLHPYY